MANDEDVARIRLGVAVWNDWRAQNRERSVDLRGANLRRVNLYWADLHEADLYAADLVNADLGGAYLREANLRGANLRGANLRGANLGGGDLREANLEGANLTETNLEGANLTETNLEGANLTGANLEGANLTRANLEGTNLEGAKLIRTTLTRANLEGANLRMTNLGIATLIGANLRHADLGRAYLIETVFADVDLTAAKGLEICSHMTPSVLDHRTLQQSGRLPLAFLRGCGLSDWQIEAAKLHQPGLTSEQITDILYRIHDLRSTRPIQIHNLFISYSHADSVFLEHVERHLNERGIRFWRDIHDAPAGPLEKIVVRAIRHNPTVLLVLSDNSVRSDWVEYEAQTARELEKELGHPVLCPVALDKSWKTCNWSAVLRNQIKKYNVLDLSDWQDATAFEGKFRRLLSGLQLFYGGEDQQESRHTSG